MEIRKNTLWRVPVYCAVAGVISFQLIIWILGQFTIEKLPDGTMTVNNTRTLLMYLC